VAIHKTDEASEGEIFFKMSATAAADQKLSAGALGIFGLILSLGDRTIGDHELIQYRKESREVIHRYLRELINAGYIIEETAKEFVYLIQGSEKYYKIGRSNNPLRRLHALTNAPFLTLLHVIPTEEGARAEKFLHKKFARVRVRGEWFSLSQTEVDWICALDKAALQQIVDRSE